jgi:hypothetical protein
MNVDADLSETMVRQSFLLRDYATLKRFWRVHVRHGVVLEVKEGEKGRDEFVHGMLERWTLAGQKTVMAFLSTAPHEAAAGAPGYSKNLLMIVNERLLGDGFAVPRVEFHRGFRTRDVSVRTEDGWSFQAHYRAPYVREFLRRLNLGNTVEYAPVDFIERLIEVIHFNRPHWLDKQA